MKFIPSIAGEYRGSFGGLVASRNKGGQYIRRRAVPTNPATDPQEVVRASMASLVSYWNDVLTEGQRAGWRNYAVQTGWSDNLGQAMDLQGVNEFVRSNVPRMQATAFASEHTGVDALAIIPDAPTIFNRGFEPVVEQTLTILTTAPGPPATAELDLVYDPSGLTTAVDTLFIYVSPALNATRRYWKGPFILAHAKPVTIAAGVGLVTFSLDDAAVTPYAVRYPTPLAGQAIHFYLRAQMADGRLSSRVYFGPLIGAPVAGP